MVSVWNINFKKKNRTAREKKLIKSVVFDLAVSFEAQYSALKISLKQNFHPALKIANPCFTSSCNKRCVYVPSYQSVHVTFWYKDVYSRQRTIWGQREIIYIIWGLNSNTNISQEDTICINSQISKRTGGSEAQSHPKHG